MDEPKKLEMPSVPASTDQANEFVKPTLPEFPPVPYTKPEWFGNSNVDCFFEVLKGGIQIETLKLQASPYTAIGRIPICQIIMEHPSVSRYHAVLQFNQKGKAFIFDLNSSHGTFLNKTKIEPRKYYPLKFGDQLKFGDSTRLFVFNEPQEPENDDLHQLTSAVGIQSGDNENPEVAEEENFYTEDPKKALYIFMENRGDEPIFEVEEEGPGHSKFYHARVRLPVYVDEADPNQALYGRGSAGKKREAERLAALDACIKLDKAGVLRGDNDGESIARNKRLKAILDDYDSDENLFYDPAAEAEKDRRNKKKQKRGFGKVETFDSLKFQSEQIQGKMLTLKEQMTKLDCQQATDDDDEFAELMGSLKKDQIEKDKKTLTSAYEKLTLELKKITKLIEIVAPGQAVQISAPVVPALKATQPIPTAQEPKLPLPVKEQSIPTKPSSELKKEHVSSSDEEPDLQEDGGKPEIEEEIETWVPPEGQTGDGRTFLNEKFGY